MKKKVLCLVLFAGLATTVFSWEPTDLTKYPAFMKPGDLILNFGVGLDAGLFPEIGVSNCVYLPPVRLTFDWNTPLGDKGLPFFMGGLLGYQGHFHTKDDYSWHRMPIGFRFGYHFNWDIDKFDTYAVATAGTTLHMGSGYKNIKANPLDWVHIGVNFGARYFVSDGFGFWAEVGYSSYSWLAIGLSFKL